MLIATGSAAAVVKFHRAGAVLQGDVVGRDGRLLADGAGGLDHLAALRQLDQLREAAVGGDLLLHAAELHQLGRELVGIHRSGRVLVLQLRQEQMQERVEVGRQRRQRVRAARARATCGGGLAGLLCDGGSEVHGDIP